MSNYKLRNTKQQVKEIRIGQSASQGFVGCPGTPGSFCRPWSPSAAPSSFPYPFSSSSSSSPFSSSSFTTPSIPRFPFFRSHIKILGTHFQDHTAIMGRGNIQFVFLTVESISSVTSNNLPYQGEIWLASVMTTVTKMPMTMAMIMLNGVEPMIMLSGS